MYKEIKAAIEDIKKNKTIVFKGNVLTREPIPGGETRRVNVDVYIKHRHKCYAVVGLVIGFVDDGVMYVTPYTPERHKIIRELYMQGAMDVPCAYGEYPVESKYRWEDIKRMDKLEAYTKYERECEEYCNYSGIKEIEGSYLTFRIPRNGIEVTEWPGNRRKIVTPILGERIVDSLTLEMIGKYRINDELCAFVNVDGHTYVAKATPELIRSLLEAGFKQGDFEVPIKHNHEIIDNELRERFQSIF